MTLETGNGFWQQVALWQSPNWPTLIVAFLIGFLAFCASVLVYDMINVCANGAMPWDGIKRASARRRFWLYVATRGITAIGCGIVGIAIS